MTWRSCIASRSADWTFGGARLISSARITFANTGPRRYSNSWLTGLSTTVPTMSDGSMSGVNCTRLNESESAAENLRTSIVFAIPGTPSRRTWPSLQSAIVSARTTGSDPITDSPTDRQRLSRTLGPSEPTGVGTGASFGTSRAGAVRSVSFMG